MIPPSLAHAQYLNLTTFRRSGQGVCTPVWFAERDGRLYCFSLGEAGKIKRLRNSDRARIAACGVRGALRGPWLEASAHVVEDPQTVARAYASLRGKYGVRMAVADFFSTLSGRIARRKVIEIEPLTRE